MSLSTLQLCIIYKSQEITLRMQAFMDQHLLNLIAPCCAFSSSMVIWFDILFGNKINVISKAKNLI